MKAGGAQPHKAKAPGSPRGPAHWGNHSPQIQCLSYSALRSASFVAKKTWPHEHQYFVSVVLE